jgi:hypothetical protein
MGVSNDQSNTCILNGMNMTPQTVNNYRDQVQSNMPLGLNLFSGQKSKFLFKEFRIYNKNLSFDEMLQVYIEIINYHKINLQSLS